MQTAREVPYPNFNFLLSFGRRGSPISGGFSDVSGIMTELTIAEYRNGNDLENHVHKIQGLHKVGDVTCKRGLVNAQEIWDWIDAARKHGPDAKRNVTIELLDESQNRVQWWTLTDVLPLKWTGPTLAGKGSTDVAMEELVLSVEGIVFGDLAG